VSGPVGLEPRFSDDGHWYWSGTQWIPATQAPVPPPPPSFPPPTGPILVSQAAPQASAVAVAPPRPRGHVGRNLAIGCGGLIALIIVISVAAAAANSGSKQPSSNSAAAVASPSTDSSKASASAPTSSPPPAAPAPVALSGAGSKVMTITLAEAPYRLSWTAVGHDNMIVHIHQGAAVEGVVNQIPPDPSAGEEFFDSPGGSLIVEVQAATLTWTITFTRIVWPHSPNPAPKQAPISLQGQGSRVTDPIYVPAGNYKLAWTAQGHDNFIVHVVWSSGSNGLVNEIPPDPASGETVFFSGGAEHLFVVDAPTLTWTVSLTPI